ncbi:MAG: helix-turn-helix domain-containing protein [Adhaeribacter sp.]
MSNQILISIPIDDLLGLIEQRVKAALFNFQPSPPVERENPITIDRVCQMLGKSKVTIHKWKREGRLKYHRISNKIYFYESEVLAALKPITRRRA